VVTSIAILFKVRRARDGDAEAIADLFCASYGLLILPSMPHIIESLGHRFDLNPGADAHARVVLRF
jgi:hypothetical protein